MKIFPVPSKLKPRAEPGTFLGYCSRSDAYRILNHRTGKIMTSAHVSFDESITGSGLKFKDLPLDLFSCYEQLPERLKFSLPFNTPPHQSSFVSSHELDSCLPYDSHDLPVIQASPSILSLLEGVNSISNLGTICLVEEQAEYNKLKPLNKTLPAPYAHQLPPEPQTAKQALQTTEADQWQKAMDEELQNHSMLKTFSVVPRPHNRAVIGCRWVFKRKTDQFGYVARYKARLVAQGYTQVEGVDFDLTYAPVVKLVSTRILLHVAAALDWEIHQIDITGAFLNSTLDREIFMELPPGYRHDKSKVYLLNKTIYGLKQSGHDWYNTISVYLHEIGFQRSNLDWGVFYSQKGNRSAILTVYVDDITIFASDLKILKKTKSLILNKFNGTDSGELKWYLGMHITRNRAQRTIIIDQQSQIEKLAADYTPNDKTRYKTPISTHEMSNIFCNEEVKPTKAVKRQCEGELDTESPKRQKSCMDKRSMEMGPSNMRQDNPIKEAAKLKNEKGKKERVYSTQSVITTKSNKALVFLKTFPYREITGSLLYLALCTRPDITFIVTLLARFQNRYEEAHCRALERIVRYLYSTKTLGMTINSPIGHPKITNPFQITGYVDADWAGDRTDRKSTTGYIYYVGTTPVDWGSTKQTSVALSSAESEYMALSEAIKKGKWIRMFMQEVHHCTKRTNSGNFLKIYEDNQSCIALAKGNVNPPKSKHIAIRYHFNREAVHSGEVTLEYCPTKGMVADILTKTPDPQTFLLNRKRLGLQEL
jgi:hypothetical protein